MHKRVSRDFNFFEKSLQSACLSYLEQRRTPSNLNDAIRYSLLAPGKRIRPRLVLATGELLGLKDEAVLPAAIAIEMIHCFTLIHDDLPCMDDDDFRRGRPSNHKVHGEGLALLAGDALLALSIEVFIELANGFPHSAFTAALRELMKATGAAGVMGGQAAESLLNRSATLEALLEMHRKKTGALFEASILVPMHLANIQSDSREGIALAQFAAAIGAAFQIADDIEDSVEAKEKPETNILSHLTKDEAKSKALKMLRESLDLASAIAHARANTLKEITHELDVRLSAL